MSRRRRGPLDSVLRRRPGEVTAVRALTDAEARVIGALLGPAGSERERLRRAEVPRSTYHAARRRAYEEGWLRDRYIPDPSRFSRRYLTFLLARPYADRQESLRQRWAADPSCVQASVSAELALGVFAHEDLRASKAAVAALDRGPQASWKFALAADLLGPSVPAFFDYEGLWMNFTEGSGSGAYPMGLGGRPGGDGTADKPVTAHQRWAASELVYRPFVATAQGRGGHLVGPFGLPFSQQRLLATGWVTHRVLLDPARIPQFRGRGLPQIVYITGTLRSGHRPEGLFQSLTRESRVFPFLFAAQDGAVLLGALGRGANEPAAASSSYRKPVMPALREALEGIEIAQAAATQFEAVVDHRYDRLFPKSPPPH